MPWGNLVSYYKVPSTVEGSVGKVWDRFLKGERVRGAKRRAEKAHLWNIKSEATILPCSSYTHTLKLCDSLRSSLCPTPTLPSLTSLLLTPPLLYLVAGDQKYRDARLKLLPVVVEGPWICQRAIGPGNAPAVIGKALPVQYYSTDRYFEVDLVVMASSVARGILSIVKSHTKSITIDLAFIIEGTEDAQLPENVLAAFRLHNLDPDKCPMLPDFVDAGEHEEEEKE